MNEEDLCTYEQALELKKLEFTYPTYYYIDEKNMGWYTTGDFINWNNGTGDIVSIPTLYQVQKWLRKEKNYHVNSSCIDKDIWYYAIDELTDNVVVARNDLEFSSYEKALSAGITECIKILTNETTKTS